MNIQVYNRELHVQHIQVRSISSSSMLFVGDAETVQSFSVYDTPPESLLVGPFLPIEPQS